MSCEETPIITNFEHYSKAGILGKITCLTNETGETIPHKVESDDSWDLAGEYHVDYHYLVTSCPKFRKCNDCPNK